MPLFPICAGGTETISKVDVRHNKSDTRRSATHTSRWRIDTVRPLSIRRLDRSGAPQSDVPPGHSYLSTGSYERHRYPPAVPPLSAKSWTSSIAPCDGYCLRETHLISSQQVAAVVQPSLVAPALERTAHSVEGYVRGLVRETTFYRNSLTSYCTLQDRQGHLSRDE